MNHPVKLQKKDCEKMLKKDFYKDLQKILERKIFTQFSGSVLHALAIDVLCFVPGN